MKKKFFIFLFFFFPLVGAQVNTDSLSFLKQAPALNLLSSIFDKQLNTFSLNSRVHFNQELGNLSFNLFENFNSKFIRTGEKSIRDEQYLAVYGTYRITDYLKAGIGANSRVYSDSRNIEINEASVSNSTVYTIINPADNIAFSPFFGYSNNRQVGENDYGFIYGVEGLTRNLLISDFLINSEMMFRNEDVSPRKNFARLYNVVLINELSEGVNNFISAGYSRNRKDFYYRADITDNIQSRTETIYHISEHLSDNSFLDAFSLDLLGNITWRNIDNINSPSLFDTKIEEIRLETEAGATYRSPSFQGGIRLNYSERDENHITKNFPGSSPISFNEENERERLKNNSSSRMSVSLSGNVLISKKDIVTFSFLQNKLKYDTPSISNFDDRDEILSIARLRYSRFLTPYFEAFAGAEGTYSHIVYIFAEKSSNNNINRVLKFSAGGNYRGKNFSSQNTFEVSANYTVYDFEDLNPNIHSFSFRQFTVNDSSLLNLTKKLSIVFYGYLKLSEQGNLKWASFSTKPQRFLEEIYIEPKIKIDFHGIVFALGMRLFSLNTYNFKIREKILDSEYLSRGPLAEITIAVRNSLDFRLYGWYEFITQEKIQQREQTNLTMQVNWNF